MSKPKFDAIKPSEEDVLAARFWLQVTEEARAQSLTVNDILNRRYNTSAHRNYFKRGESITFRYDLVMSPEFETKDEEADAAYQRLYSVTVDSPLLKLEKGRGRRAKYIGLVLRPVPHVNMPHISRVRSKPTRQMDNYELSIVRAIWEVHKGDDSHEVRLTESFLKQCAAVAMGGPNILGHNGLDLTVDFNGYSRRVAGEIAESEGYGLASGVNYHRMHEFYLTKGGSGRILYFANNDYD